MASIALLILFVIICCLQVWRHPDDSPYLASAMGIAIFVVILPAFKSGDIITGIIGAVVSAVGGIRLPVTQIFSPARLWRI